MAGGLGHLGLPPTDIELLIATVKGVRLVPSAARRVLGALGDVLAGRSEGRDA